MHRTRVEAIVAAAARYEAAAQDEAAAEDAAKCAGERILDAQRRQDEATAELDRLAAPDGGQVFKHPAEALALRALDDLLKALPLGLRNGQVVVTGVDGGADAFEFIKEPERAKVIRLRLAERERQMYTAIRQARRLLQRELEG